MTAALIAGLALNLGSPSLAASGRRWDAPGQDLSALRSVGPPNTAHIASLLAQIDSIALEPIVTRGSGEWWLSDAIEYRTFEVLARSTNPHSGKLYTPMATLRLLEHVAPNALTERVIDLALRNITQPPDEPHPATTFHFNLPPAALHDKAFVAWLMRQAAFDPKQIVFEILERQPHALRDPRARSAIAELHRRGYRWAMDDLRWAERSVAEQLRDVGVDVAKVNDSAVIRANHEPLGRWNEWARCHQITMVAERIERREQLQTLREYDRFTGFQGYFFGGRRSVSWSRQEQTRTTRFVPAAPHRQNPILSAIGFAPHDRHDPTSPSFHH